MPVYLTFYHAREIFRGSEFKPWVNRLFPNGVRYEGTKSAMYEPTIIVSLQDFEDSKENIPTKNLIRIKGSFTILEQLTFGVRNFDNKIKEATE